ncbi:ATP-binding protein [Nocardiopsis sediminis]|uniref:ATP-binding protein n=1 Tax=Nocardiopsis sediminis TaxID=1778267 RepID=A0ABV8FKV1_9ACTN
MAAPRGWWFSVLHDKAAAPRECPAGGPRQDALCWTLEAGPGAAAGAREVAAGALRQWSMGGFANDAELILSELVTNALRHASRPAEAAIGRRDTIEVCILRHGGELICAVRDGSDLLPARREPDFMLETGRGLHLVACFATDWGVVPVRPAGKYVWALLR